MTDTNVRPKFVFTIVKLKVLEIIIYFIVNSIIKIESSLLVYISSMNSDIVQCTISH